MSNQFDYATQTILVILYYSNKRSIIKVKFQRISGQLHNSYYISLL